MKKQTKLIVEISHGTVYAYMEDKKHFKSIKRNKKHILNPSSLNEECDLSCYPDKTVFIFDIKTKKDKK